MSLDPAAIPASGRQLLPLAERWGIGDDYERELAVGNASEEELQVLAESMERVGDDFWEWLAGEASYASHPSREYLAMTALTMAADSARVRLAKRQVR